MHVSAHACWLTFLLSSVCYAQEDVPPHDTAKTSALQPDGAAPTSSSASVAPVQQRKDVTVVPVIQPDQRQKSDPCAASTTACRSGIGNAPAPTVERRWYGWQTLLADATALGVGIAGANRNELALGLTGVGIGLLGAPIIHAAHGNWEGAGASLAMRAAVPLLSYGILSIDDLRTPGAALLLLGGGTIAVVAIDSSMFAYETREQKVSFTPRLSASPQGVSVGLSGAF